MDSASLSLEYWKLGNAITAFAVVQVIATAIPVGANLDVRQALGRISDLALILIVLAATVLYCAGLSGCFFAELALSARQNQTEVLVMITWWTYFARLGIVLIANIAIGILLVRVANENRIVTVAVPCIKGLIA